MKKNDQRIEVALQQPIIPDYRMGLFYLLREQWGSKFQIFAGDADFSGTPISTEEAWKYYQRVENHYIFGRRFLWQSGCFKALFGAKVTILNGNLRMLSNSAVMLLRRLLGRPTILWGHAVGQSRMASLIRGVYLRFCDGFIAYTESQATDLRERYPWLKVWVAPNSCVFASDCQPVEAEPSTVNTFLYVGRLVKKKKVRLLLDAFIEACEQDLLSEEIRLIYVGEGEERPELEARVNQAGLKHRVEFVGHESDVAKLREYYAQAICAVSPGYVGLSATQSFSFGVPMLIARDEFHSPEIEACEEGFNAQFFESNNTEQLAFMFKEMHKEKSIWLEKREEISHWTRSKYSFEVMADTFNASIAHVSQLKRI